MDRRSHRRRRIHSLLACLAVVGVVGGFVPAAASGPEPVPIAIIVSSEWESLSQVSVRDLRRIYLRTSDQLAGVEVRPVDHPPNSAIYRAFVKQVVRKSRKVLADYWLEQALTGGVHPPRQMENSASVINFVAGNIGAIGYVGLDALEGAQNAGVKILMLAQSDGVMRPSQTDYELRFTER